MGKWDAIAIVGCAIAFAIMMVGLVAFDGGNKKDNNVEMQAGAGE